MPEPSRWDSRTIRGDPARLRNLQEAVRELRLVLDELEEMTEAERLQAHLHHRHVHNLLDRMADLAGPMGEDPIERERRRDRKIRPLIKGNTENGRRS